MKSALLCSFFGGCVLMLASCSATKFPVSFHLQGEDSDSKKMVFSYTINGRPYCFQKAGFIGNRDIESYRSFQDPKTASYGAAFYLTPAGKIRYQALTAQNVGKLVLPQADGIPRQAFRITGEYKSGIVYIYSGLTREDMNKMKKVIEPHPKEIERLKFNDNNEKEKIKKLQE